MIQISEWLPNPIGTDTQGEWVELYNSGPTASLVGWSLKIGSSSKFVFKSGEIGANSFLVLPRSEIKLTLRNFNESLYLMNPTGKI